MKDINEKSLDLGIEEAQKLLNNQFERGKITAAKMATTLASIHPSLSYAGIENSEIVVEAVVENPKVKAAVLSEVESLISPDTLLASNTSTIPISILANSLKRPENFCGMHFFNPVHRMPLVEIIRGKQTLTILLLKSFPMQIRWAKRQSLLMTAQVSSLIVFFSLTLQALTCYCKMVLISGKLTRSWKKNLAGQWGLLIFSM
ncbi:hypothetical protein MASR2M36_38130 [Providencia sp.]